MGRKTTPAPAPVNTSTEVAAPAASAAPATPGQAWREAHRASLAPKAASRRAGAPTEGQLFELIRLARSLSVDLGAGSPTDADKAAVVAAWADKDAQQGTDPASAGSWSSRVAADPDGFASYARAAALGRHMVENLAEPFGTASDSIGAGQRAARAAKPAAVKAAMFLEALSLPGASFVGQSAPPPVKVGASAPNVFAPPQAAPAATESWTLEDALAVLDAAKAAGIDEGEVRLLLKNPSFRAFGRQAFERAVAAGLDLATIKVVAGC